jgi:hypothetical protein
MAPVAKRYAGLPSIDGIRWDSCSLSRLVSCPFCSSPDVALLAGKVRFAATMGQEIVADQEPLAAFLCPNAHVFLVRECDVAPVHVPSLAEGRTHSRPQ